MRTTLVQRSSWSMLPQLTAGDPAGTWIPQFQILWLMAFIDFYVHAPEFDWYPERKSCVNLTIHRLCSYPQHITLQLGERSRVRKLQLLAHQYLIPAKVEFHIGDSQLEISTQGFPGQLRRLGWDYRLGGTQLLQSFCVFFPKDCQDCEQLSCSQTVACVVYESYKYKD